MCIYVKIWFHSFADEVSVARPGDQLELLMELKCWTRGAEM